MRQATGEHSGPAGRRGYRSRLREEQAAATRRTIVEAARERFLTEGWSATGVRDIAADAGVAVETVYSHYSSKRGLLRAVADVAVVGDDAPVPLAQRDEFLAMGKGRRPTRIRAAAQVLTAVQVRTSGLAKLLREAAYADHEIADMLRTTRENQRSDIGRALGMVMGRAPTDAERDGVWAVASPEVYLLLVEESGWTPEQYETWVAETLERIVPRS